MIMNNPLPPIKKSIISYDQIKKKKFLHEFLDENIRKEKKRIT